MQAPSLNLKNLYRLPWSTYDNPTGWIEPTTYCQLACPGCYRGLDQPNPTRKNEDLKEQEKQIDTLIKIRKIQTIAIAGGEPLLYPHLDKLVAYAHKKRLGVRILTNGCLLTEKRLEKLKSLGVTEIIIHVGQYQNRAKDKKSLYKLREYYCQMFRKIKDVNLIFVSMVTRQNFSSLPKLLDFYKNNSDIISLFIFTTYQDVFPQERLFKQRYVSAEKIRAQIYNIYKTPPCAYLPRSINKNSYSWLYHTMIFHNKRILGGLSGNAAELIYKDYQIYSKTAFHQNGTNIKVKTLLALLKEKSIRKIILAYLKNLASKPSSVTQRLNAQMSLIINTPKFTKDGWDACEGCPDAMIYNNDLVRSCLLERVKAGKDRQGELLASKVYEGK